MSISGYGNGVHPNGTVKQGYEDPRAYNSDDFPIKSKAAAAASNYNDYNEYDDGAYPLPSANSDKPKFQPTKATQARLKAKAAALAVVNTPENQFAPQYALPPTGPTGNVPTSKKNARSNNNNDAEYEVSVGGGVKEDFVQQPFKNAEAALREAMNNLSQDEDWEKKCHGLNAIRRLTAYHEDTVVSNIHPIILALVQEVKNLRSQVARFALITFGDMFAKLKRSMDVDLDLTVKNILQKNGESNDFIRADVDKCLDKMVNNVTVTKAMIALLSGGAR